MEVPLGVTVLEAEIRAGLEPDAPCGGQGSCGKCLVKVNGNPVLACQTKVVGDCQVEIPGKKKRGKGAEKQKKKKEQRRKKKKKKHEKKKKNDRR